MRWLDRDPDPEGRKRVEIETMMGSVFGDGRVDILGNRLTDMTL